MQHDPSTAEARSGNPRYDTFRNHDMVVRLYGDTAIVSGMTSIRRSHDGESFELDARFAGALVKYANRCKLVASLASWIGR